jgi:LysM domain
LAAGKVASKAHGTGKGGFARGGAVTAKQWLLITFVVILNIIIFGTLLDDGSAGQFVTPTSVWTPHPTFTPAPFPTATAILMPTEPALPVQSDAPIPTPQTHVVQEGETLESVAETYGIGIYALKMLNRMSDGETVRVGQELLVPAAP